MLIFVLPNLTSAADIAANDFIGIFAGAFVASPIIGYLIYAWYPPYYENISKNSDRRGALKYIKDLEFIEDTKKEDYRKLLKCHTQRKEFLDLIFSSTHKHAEVNFDSEAVKTIKNHLSNYAARIVCGKYVLIANLISAVLIGIPGSFLPNGQPVFTWNPLFVALWLGLSFTMSYRLLRDAPRVLDEAYRLEEYLVKAKKAEVLTLLGDLLTANKAAKMQS
jgi:hypothetical protein